MSLDKLTDKEVEDFENKTIELLGCFREEMKKICDETISDFYTDILPNIYGDALTNFRNAMMSEISNESPSSYAFDKKELRQLVWKDNKGELVELLNADLLKENERLQGEVDLKRDWFRKFK